MEGPIGSRVPGIHLWGQNWTIVQLSGPKCSSTETSFLVVLTTGNVLKRVWSSHAAAESTIRQWQNDSDHGSVEEFKSQLTWLRCSLSFTLGRSNGGIYRPDFDPLVVRFFTSYYNCTKYTGRKVEYIWNGGAGPPRGGANNRQSRKFFFCISETVGPIVTKLVVQ
jgi:hypothetical protein